MIECNKENCKMRYIGETKRIFKFRMAEHIGYVQNKDDTPRRRGNILMNLAIVWQIWKCLSWKKLKRMMNYTEKNVNIILSENLILFTKD